MAKEPKEPGARGKSGEAKMRRDAKHATKVYLYAGGTPEHPDPVEVNIVAKYRNLRMVRLLTGGEPFQVHAKTLAERDGGDDETAEAPAA